MVSAQDVPLASRVAREYLTALQNTTKHVKMIDVTRPAEAAALARMARELQDAGVIEEPAVSMLISVVSPLLLELEATEAALEAAAARLPVAVCSMPISSITAPATLHGTVLMAHADILGLITIMQTLNPGAPVIYCSFPVFADPRTGSVNYSDRRSFWVIGAAAQMGRSLDIPCFTSCDLSSLTVGSDLVSTGGLLEVSTLLSFEQVVLENESLRNWRLAMAPQEVNAETLALDVIREVGPGGSFLAQRHTATHIREFRAPRFVEPDYPGGKVHGAPSKGSSWEQARAEARRLLDSHQVEPLPPRVLSSLERIVESTTATDS
jgi:trimethylamine--corrinoid protein Co-methyltransferase